ncbi:hypothetical protein M8J76_005007 [Diaphorina citri]|nr:hypothetical protein M8J76_005007 [Diaphorina citri]
MGMINDGGCPFCYSQCCICASVSVRNAQLYPATSSPFIQPTPQPQLTSISIVNRYPVSPQPTSLPSTPVPSSQPQSNGLVIFQNNRPVNPSYIYPAPPRDNSFVFFPDEISAAKRYSELQLVLLDAAGGFDATFDSTLTTQASITTPTIVPDDSVEMVNTIQLSIACFLH